MKSIFSQKCKFSITYGAADIFQQLKHFDEILTFLQFKKIPRAFLTGFSTNSIQNL